MGRGDTYVGSEGSPPREGHRPTPTANALSPCRRGRQSLVCLGQRVSAAGGGSVFPRLWLTRSPGGTSPPGPGPGPTRHGERCLQTAFQHPGPSTPAGPLFLSEEGRAETRSLCSKPAGSLSREPTRPAAATPGPEWHEAPHAQPGETSGCRNGHSHLPAHRR